MTAAGYAIHLLLLFAFPPLLLGVISKTKAAFAGRRGAPLLQLYFDLWKLFRKDLVISLTTTWVFVAAPVISLVTISAAGLLVPLGGFDSPIHFSGDLILFVYLFGLARFLTTSAALDTGSSFEGMGAAREVSFACLAEPAILFALLVLVKMSNALNLNEILQGVKVTEWATSAAPLILTAVGLFIVLLAENCRIPFDDPNTHLELTMIHEVMVLDHSGPLFGLILYGAALKLFVLASILIHILAPAGSAHVLLDTLIFTGGMVLLAVLIGVVESVMARLQLRHIPYLLTAAILFPAFGFLLVTR